MSGQEGREGRRSKWESRSLYMESSSRAAVSDACRDTRLVDTCS